MVTVTDWGKPWVRGVGFSSHNFMLGVGRDIAVVLKKVKLTDKIIETNRKKKKSLAELSCACNRQDH